MQERKTQAERRDETRSALLSAARQIFAEKGYAETGTPDIVQLAGVTRGALYHHFADKKDLFRAVVEEEHRTLALGIEGAGDGDSEAPGPIKALILGSEIFVAAMQDPGRRRIMLVDAPAILGREAVDEIDARHGMDTLICGVRDAMDAGAMRRLPIEPLAHLFGAMFDRAALAPPDQAADFAKAIKAMIRGLKT
jgi:AcrR family transcriptional regulator